MRRTRTRPTRPRRASTHTRAGPGRGVLRPESGGVGVHTKQAPVQRPSPPSNDGRYGRRDASVTASTHANNRSAGSLRPKPEGPARYNRIAGPRTGTTRSEPSALASAGPSGRHKEPGSRPASTCPVQPPNKAGGDSPRGRGRHHGDGKADRSIESDRTGRGAAHQRGATRHAREARRRPQPQHEDKCQATTATGCREPRKHAEHTRNRATGECAKDSRAPTPAQRIHSQCEAGPGYTPERTRGRGWESARLRTPHTQARGAPHGRLPAAHTARKASSQERTLWVW